jgi:c(7)-type cytochrome triheme protein
VRGRLAAAALLLAAAALPLAAAAWSTEAIHDQGRVVLDGFSTRAGMPPVQFDHWRHRARHTCRLCHVDVGFAMTAGATEVSAATNRAGHHCGACHDGVRRHGGAPVFAACGDRPDGAPGERCLRCHTRGDAAARRREFEAFAVTLPRKGGGGRGIDWEEAEARRLVRPVDHLQGVSIRRRPLRRDVDVLITSRGWMTDVLFSHRKHAAWNGCEVCHPDIFPSRPGAVRYSMVEINSGESCGACHGKVAFSIGDCERCHVARGAGRR